MGAKLLELVRVGVMPLITLSGWGTLIYAILWGDISKVPNWFYVAAIANSAWWFAAHGMSNGGGKVPPDARGP